jgi:hypothetical protein
MGIKNPTLVLQVNNSWNYYIIDVLKQKVTKLIELWNSYSTKIMGHQGLEHFNPTFSSSIGALKTNSHKTKIGTPILNEHNSIVDFAQKHIANDSNSHRTTHNARTQ